MHNLFFGDSLNIVELCTESILIKDLNYKLICNLTINAEKKLFFKAEYSLLVKPNDNSKFLSLFYLRKIINEKNSNSSYDELEIILDDVDIDYFLEHPNDASIKNIYKKIKNQYSNPSSKKIKSLLEISSFELFDLKLTNWIILYSNMGLDSVEVKKMLKSADSSLVL